MNKELMFSSETDQWSTPQEFFDRVDRVFKFTLDVCADSNNHKVDTYFDVSTGLDGLKMNWEGTCWMNPPYGREIGAWVKKAYDSAMGGAVVVCLLPARVDTRWWHEYCKKGEVLFIKGRLKFGDAKSSAPFPSALVVFRLGLKQIDVDGWAIT